jgi:hypothetical protein
MSAGHTISVFRSVPTRFPAGKRTSDYRAKEHSPTPSAELVDLSDTRQKGSRSRAALTLHARLIWWSITRMA